MSPGASIGGNFPRRSIVTNLVAGAIISLFVIHYFGVGHGAGVAAGVLLGSLHLYTWMGLGRQLLGPRDPLWIALYVFLKLGVVYAGAILYLLYQRPYAAAFTLGFSLIFVVMIQKVVGRRILAASRPRTAPKDCEPGEVT